MRRLAVFYVQSFVCYADLQTLQARKQRRPCLQTFIGTHYQQNSQYKYSLSLQSVALITSLAKQIIPTVDVNFTCEEDWEAYTRKGVWLRQTFFLTFTL